MIAFLGVAAIAVLVGLFVSRRRPVRRRTIALGSVTPEHRARLETDDATRPRD